MYKIPGQTVFIGKKIISLPSCESTNTVMSAMAQEGRIVEGVVIVTDNQTGGRGQAGNRWVVEGGANLTFSVLLKPNFIEPSQQFYLNMAIGLGVYDCINEVLNESNSQDHLHPPTNGKVELKWPNDLMVDSKKVCGILIENQVQSQQLLQSVVGIGLNVNQKNFEWPNVSSLRLIAGIDFNKDEVLKIALIKLEERYEQLRSKNFQKLKADYYSVLFWKDEGHHFESGGKIFYGTIEGVDEVGRLLVLVNGGIERYNFKEIKFLK